MNKKIEKNLGFLGEEFQYRLVKQFMEDVKFFAEINTVVDQNMFTDFNLKLYVSTLKDLYNRNQLLPSYETIEIQMKAVNGSNEIDSEIIEETIKRVKNTTIEASDIVRDNAIKFFKQQNLLKIINEAYRDVTTGNLDKLDSFEEKFRDAFSVGHRHDMGEKVYDDLEELLSPDYRKAVPTGLELIDGYLEGGLGKGELGIIIGPSGFGKALSVNELVATPNGYVKNGTLKVNDIVIGKNGKPIKVNGVYPQGMRNAYKITFTDDISVVCDIEHIWHVNHLKKKDNDGNLLYENKTLKEILKHPLYSNPYTNIDYDDKRFNFSIPIADPIHFPEREINTNPYDYGVKISEKRLSFFRDKRINNEYLYNSIDNRILLLNGLMDVGGSVDENGKAKYFFENKTLGEDFRQLILSLGGFATIQSGEHVYGEKKSFVIFQLTDNSIPIFKNKDMQSRVVYKEEKFRYIERIEQIEDEEMLCIKVDAEDELYLTRDYIVTHNTTLSTSMAQHASITKSSTNNDEGFKVLQIFFEDKYKQIKRKHVAKITNIEARNLSKPEFIDEVREKLRHSEDRDLISKNLMLKKFPTGETNVPMIKQYVNKLIIGGFKPDLIIVDYFECLAPTHSSSTTNEWKTENRTMRELESMASDLDVALWLTTQGTKDSLSGKIVTLDKAGGSVGKIQIGHIILSISRMMGDISNNMAKIAILKNRAGISDIFLDNVDFNNGTCVISTDRAIQFEDPNMFYDNLTETKENNMTNTMKNLMSK